MQEVLRAADSPETEAEPEEGKARRKLTAADHVSFVALGDAEPLLEPEEGLRQAQVLVVGMEGDGLLTPTEAARGAEAFRAFRRSGREPVYVTSLSSGSGVMACPSTVAHGRPVVLPRAVDVTGSGERDTKVRSQGGGRR